MDIPDSTSKWCYSCVTWKPRTEFGKNRSRPDGLAGECRSCRKTQNAESHARNKAQRNEARRKKRLANFEVEREKARIWEDRNRERRNAQARQWRKDNPERFRENQRRGYHKHKDERNARRRAAYAENPEPFKARESARRAVLRGVEGRYTEHDAYDKYTEQNGKCYWCSEALNGEFQVDHIIPLSRGGGNGPGNICCACEPCNRRKHNKMPWEFSDRLF